MLFSSALGGVLTLAAALFCRMLGVFVVLPVAAPLVLARPDGSALAAGLVLGAYGLTQALMQAPMGILADRIGKKPALLGALAVFAAGGFAAAAADTVAGMVAGRLAQGLGAVAAVSAAWVADIAPPRRRAPAMAAFGAVIALAFAASLFIASPLAAAAGLSGVFYLTGWLGVASFALVALLPAPPVAAPATATDASPLAILRQLLQNASLRRLAFGAFALHYAMATLFFALPLVTQTPVAELWRVYAAGFVCALPPAALLIAKVERRPQRCLRAAIAALLAAAALLPHAASFGAAALALFFFFAGFVALEAALPALTAAAAPPARRAAAMGVLMTCEFSGVFCGGLAAGALSDGKSAIIPLIVMGALLALWFWRPGAPGCTASGRA